MLSKEMTVQGLVLNNDKEVIQGNIVYRKSPEEDFDPERDGRAIDMRAANIYVEDRTNWDDQKEDAIVAITFRSEAFFDILTQNPYGVPRGIRIYLAKNGDLDETLVMTGIDENGDDLGIKNPGNGKIASVITGEKIYSHIEPLIIQVGGGDKRVDFKDYPPSV